MFDIGFGEILLVFVIGLIVLGPERLPVAVRTVMGWLRALRSLASNVQQELAQELKLQEFQDSLKKVEEVSKGAMPPELKASVEELRKSADSMQRTYRDALHFSHDHPPQDDPLSVQQNLPESTGTQEVEQEVKQEIKLNSEPVSVCTQIQANRVSSSPRLIDAADNQHAQAVSAVTKNTDNNS